MRFELECGTDSGGRLAGTVGWEGRDPVPFCGTLELLRLLQDHAPRRPAPASPPAPATSDEP